MTPSEKFVADLCEKTFLSLWSFPNPKRADNKNELCDLLVINHPYIIIFSVKEINIKDSGKLDVDFQRWKTRAIDESVKQIYGAEKALRDGVVVLDCNDNKITEIVEIPKKDDWQMFRIAVSFGRGEKFPIYFGDFGKGFFHTFDEKSISIVLQELDTITDFADYLIEKENYFKSGKKILTDGEENILAVYLHNDRKLPSQFDDFHIVEEIWDDFTKKEEFIRKKDEDRESYIWDEIIKENYSTFLPQFNGTDIKLKEIEIGLRVMSKETRFSRRILSKAWLDFIGYYAEPKSKARIIESFSGIIYVYLLDEHREDKRELRIMELGLRCFIARGMNKESKIVVGLATNRYRKDGGHSFDLYCLEKPNWTEEDEKKMKEMQDDLGFFKKPQLTEKHFDEYPNS